MQRTKSIIHSSTNLHGDVMDIYIPNMDLDILYLQHADLMEEIWDKPDSLLWGLVEMLDYILDEYYDWPLEGNDASTTV